jgi:hypothetical protein
MTEDEGRRRKAMTKEDEEEDRIGIIKNDDEYTSWQRKRIK